MRKKLFSLQELENIVITLQGLPEKAARLFLGRKALEKGRGAVTELCEYCHVSRKRISRGIHEVLEGQVYKVGDRSRKPGGGRWSIAKKLRVEMAKKGLTGKELDAAADIAGIIDDIVDQWSYGDPMSEDKWINATVQQVCNEACARTGMSFSCSTTERIIKRLGYSFQKNQKYDQVGKAHPNRNDQFVQISTLRAEFEGHGDPIISIDTKAKMQLGNYYHSGHELRKKHDPRKVWDHDFACSFGDIYPEGSPLIPQELMKNLAIVSPYGVYDVTENTGFVLFGVSRDTSEFAAEAITRWWEDLGKAAYPNARRLLILADGGGSNKARGYLLKEAVQQIADTTGLEIYVSHYPPGTSKYNPIERKLWSQVTRTCAAKPLLTLEHAMEYTCHTNTQSGLHVQAESSSQVYLSASEKKQMLERGLDPYGIIDTNELRDDINIEYYGEEGVTEAALRKWNYTIRPHESERAWKNFRKSVLTAY